jgi:hypothetical protein
MEFFMRNYPGGWNSLQNSFPQNITDVVSVARSTFGTPPDGQIVYDNLFNTPTGGTWAASPIVLSQEPDVQAINVTFNAIDGIEASAMNAQTKMANLSTSVPSQLQGLVYLYTPVGQPRFWNRLYLNLGGGTYNRMQISIFENSVTRGDAHGNIQAYDFGTGPFTGTGTIQLLLSSFTGQINLGIRLESTGGDSSLFELRTIAIPV